MLEDNRFDFDQGYACLAANALIFFKIGQPIEVTKYDCSTEPTAMIVSQLQSLYASQRLTLFAICATSDRNVLLTGGADTSVNNISEKAFQLDVVENRWHDMPSLTVKRFAHSSCATPASAFVFGGYDADAKPLVSLETIKLADKRSILGNSKKKWSKFTLQNSISGRNNALMVKLYSNDILIIGGAANDFEP